MAVDGNPNAAFWKNAFAKYELATEPPYVLLPNVDTPVPRAKTYAELRVYLDKNKRLQRWLQFRAHEPGYRATNGSTHVPDQMEEWDTELEEVGLPFPECHEHLLKHNPDYRADYQYFTKINMDADAEFNRQRLSVVFTRAAVMALWAVRMAGSHWKGAEVAEPAAKRARVGA